MLLVKRQNELHQERGRTLSQICHKIMLDESNVLYKELMAEPRPSREFGISGDIGDDHIQNNRLMPRCTGPECKKKDKGLLYVVPMGTLSLLDFFIFPSDALFSV